MAQRNYSYHYPEDYRIGNYINYQYQPYKITALNKVAIGITLDGETVLKDWRVFGTVELTEEWLLRFGFETNSVNYNACKNDFLLERNFDESYRFSFNGKMIYVKYVHQLQNLYFSLTKEELEEAKPETPTV